MNGITNYTFQKHEVFVAYQSPGVAAHRQYNLLDSVFRAFLTLIKRLFAKAPAKSVVKYAFTQQYNDSCHLSSLVNLKLLNRMCAQHHNIGMLPYLTRRQWHGEDQRMLNTWHGLMSKLSKKGAEHEYPHLVAFLKEGIEQGPNAPHFYSNHGRPYFQGLKGFFDFHQMPYFLMDFESFKKMHFRIGSMSLNFETMFDDVHLGILTGIVRDRNTYKIYNSQTKEYEPTNGKPWILFEEREGKKYATFREDLLTPAIRSVYQLPNEGVPVLEMTPTQSLGFQEIGINEKQWGGIRLTDANGVKHSYITFGSSLLKLMLLTAGVDENNDPIDKRHDLYYVHLELKKLMSEDRNNPWHPDNLKKGMLFQYQLANLFKRDRKLFAMAKQAICQYNPRILENYHKLKEGALFNQNGKSFNSEIIKNYLLGEEQLVAYFFTSPLRCLWYSAINPKASEKAIEEIGLPGCLARLTARYMKHYFFKKFSFTFGNERSEQVSYLDVWKKVRKQFLEQAKYTGRKNFVSFDEHGWVISFDPTIMEYQRRFTKKIYDKALLQELNFAGVESWLSSEMRLWYTRGS